MVESDALVWANRVFGDCELGDRRRTARLVDLGGRLADSGGGSVASACGDDGGASEGGYRFVRNQHIKVQDVAKGGFRATAQHARDCELLLAIQDTTTLSYSHSTAKQLGDLGGPAASRARGWFVHSTLLLDGVSGHTVGLIDQKRWKRPIKGRGKRHQRKQRPYEKKESFKWEGASNRYRKLLGSKTMKRVIDVDDREADVYEYLTYKLERKDRFVIRSCRDRSVDSEMSRLWQTVGSQAPLGNYEVKVTQRGVHCGKGGKVRKARKARIAKITVRATQVTLNPPRRTDRKLQKQEIQIVQALEEQPPEGEEALKWLLLTTEPVYDFGSARQVIRYYELRWRIEELHKVWKTGCGVEQQRHQKSTNLERMAVVLVFVAVRLLQLKEQCEQNPEQPCTKLLSETAWKCLMLILQKKAPSLHLPDSPPTLSWSYASLGRLGGFQDTKRTGRIGWSTLWKGWMKLADHVEGFEIALRAVREGTM